MVNKTLRNTIGGLAVLAGVVGSSMADTNDVPRISKIEVENVTPSNMVVRIYATNFDSDKVKNCYIYKTTNLTNDWTKAGLKYSTQSSITNVVSKEFRYTPSDPEFNKCFYKIKGEEK